MNKNSPKLLIFKKITVQALLKVFTNFKVKIALILSTVSCTADASTVLFQINDIREL
jgi:hypothetical protein